MPRPGETLVNRLVLRLLSRRTVRAIDRDDVLRWVEDSIAHMRVLGAADDELEYTLALARREWIISDDAAPPEVWCGEVLWPPPEAEPGTFPTTLLYPDSPWGRMPGGLPFELASQTGIDHMVSHLARWRGGRDFSEEAACADQVRLMLARRQPVTILAALFIALGLRLHKQIPLRVFGPIGTQ